MANSTMAAMENKQLGDAHYWKTLWGKALTYSKSIKTRRICAWLRWPEVKYFGRWEWVIILNVL